jgi:hypothetical protein
VLSPRYSARKQYVPGALGVKLGVEVAVDVIPSPLAANVAEPALAPPVAHPDALANGPQTEKFTVPVGLPPVLLPDTVATSVFESPNVIDALVGAEPVDEVWPTKTHSPAEASLDGSFSVSPR